MQCGIYRLRDSDDRVCRVQSDLGVETTHVLCAPIIPRSQWGSLVPKMHLLVQANGEPQVVIMSQMVAIPSVALGPLVGDISPWRDEIVAAVDLLVTGF